MRKLFLIAGHSLNDPGAVSTVKESDLTIELRNLINYELLKIGVAAKTDKDSQDLSTVIKWVNSDIKESDLLIDLHFNSFSTEKATGCEVLIKSDSPDQNHQNAKSISSIISETLSIKDRGVKTEKDSARGKIGILNGDGYRYLLEVCFISNPNDLENYQASKLKLAYELSLEIGKIMKQ